MGDFVATHTVPEGGTRAWDAPDPSRPPVATLDPHLPVRVLEMQPNGWAHVLCSNDWSAWVDGRSLVSLTSTAPAAGRSTSAQLNLLFEPAEVSTVGYAGAAAAVVGGFLPWLTVAGHGFTAWDLGMVALLRGHGPSTGIKAGLVLFVVALVGLPRLTNKPLPAIAVAALGAVATNIALLALMANSNGHLHAGIGIGLVLTLAGGGAILADFLQGLQRTSRAVTA